MSRISYNCKSFSSLKYNSKRNSIYIIDVSRKIDNIFSISSLHGISNTNNNNKMINNKELFSESYSL